MKNPEVYFTYLKDLFKQGFKFERYKNLPMVLRVIMFILLLPVFLLGMLSSLNFVIFYGFYRIVKAPAEYIMSFVRSEGKVVNSPAQLIIYLIGFPIALAFELLSLVIWVFLCLLFLETSIMFSIFTLGSTNFYPFLFSQKERVSVKPYQNPILNFIINTIIIVVFLTLAIIYVCQLKEEYAETNALINAFIGVSFIGYVVVPFEKHNLLSKNKKEDNSETKEENTEIKEEVKETQEEPVTLVKDEETSETVNSQKECPKRRPSKLTSILISVIVVVLTVSAVVLTIHFVKPKSYDTPSDAIVQENEYFQYKLKDNKVYDLVCTNQNVTDVNLVMAFSEYEVISLGESAFSNCHKLSVIYLPNTLKRIKKSAFNQCFSLTKITLPLGLEIIEDHAFSSTSIRSILIPKSVRKMGGYIFSYNIDLYGIYCEAKSKPNGWDKDWDVFQYDSRYDVYYGVK